MKRLLILIPFLFIMFACGISSNNIEGGNNMTLFLSIIYNLFFMLVIVFVIAFGFTKMLNPTASIKEIFNHWGNTYKKECHDKLP